MIDDLVKIALVGTARGGGNGLPPPPAGPLADALAALPPAGGPEAALLRTTAVASAYAACGRVPAAGPVLPSPAPPDVRSACSPKAADALARILAMSSTPAKARLVDEWLDHAARAGRRPPHSTLPDLLDYGADRRASQSRIAAVIDERGRWLVAQNPRWQFGADAEQDPAVAWATGTPPQRLSALRRARRADPAAARTMVQSTWKEDGADGRSAFVAALADGLSSADEPFLESALDDRSKQVRSAALDLLARLPTSAFVARMTARADAMLAVKGKKVDVTLPTKFDPAWTRDGVTEKPTEKLGQKQWWLRQIVAAVPPAHWTASWRLDPAGCLKVAAGDFDGLLTEAWSDAAERNRDSAWLLALLGAAVRDKQGLTRLSMLDALPEADRAALLAEALETPRLPLAGVAEILESTKFPLDRRAADAALRYLDRHGSKAPAHYEYMLPQLLNDLALAVPPETYDGAAGRWSGRFWDANAKALEQFLQTLQLRREVQREFAT